MTEILPRDRVLRALRHEEPDRVPIEFGSPATLSMVDGEPYGYAALCDLLGIEGAAPPILARAFSNSVTNVDPRILARFGADLRWVGPEEFGNYRFPGADQQTVDALLRD